MIVYPITATFARFWHRQQIGGAFPAGLTWVFVEGLEYAPSDRPAYLLSGADGLYGIVAVKVKAKIARRAA